MTDEPIPVHRAATSNGETSKDSRDPDVERLATEISDRLAAAGLTPAGQLRVLAKVLIEAGYRFASPELPKERRALEEFLSDSRGDLPLPAAMILQGYLLEEWLLERKEDDYPPATVPSLMAGYDHAGQEFGEERSRMDSVEQRGGDWTRMQQRLVKPALLTARRLR